MTIVSVRIYYYPDNTRRERALTEKHWGFAEWFPRRLKPMKERLRGEEAKGVNVVNFMLYENPARAWRLNEWGRRLNTFEHDSVYDLANLTKRKPSENVRELMKYTAGIALRAPWPQVVAVGEALDMPLTPNEEQELLPFLQWPRGNA
jgi:hypothetical protein